MVAAEFRFGYRILGPPWNPRQVVVHEDALTRYATLDDWARCDEEGYLSACTFAEDFCRHVTDTGSTVGFSGPCCSSWLWWDIDRQDLTVALTDARRLVVALIERYGCSDGGLVVFFSGAKGFHVGLATSLWLPAPSVNYNRIGRQFAEFVGASAGVTIDRAIYDRLRALRAPNSRHPKTGLHKRRLTYDQLMNASVDEILKLAERPEPFELPQPRHTSDQAAADWQSATAAVERQTEKQAEAKAAYQNGGGPPLNRLTLAFIEEGAPEGERHVRLFQAAANLAELGVPLSAAKALLWEAALKSGLPPKEIARQIDCGWRYGASTSAAGAPATGGRQTGQPDYPRSSKAPSRNIAGRFDVPNALVDERMAGLSPVEALTLVVLYRDARDGIATVSQRWLAARMGCSVRTVKRAIARLRRLGLVVVAHQGGKDQGISKYRVWPGPEPSSSKTEGDSSSPGWGTPVPQARELSVQNLGNSSSPCP